MNVVVAGSLWVVFLIFTLRAKTRPDNTLYYALLFIAVAMTANVEFIYLGIAEISPYRNAADYFGSAAMILGLFLLLRSIRRGSASPRLHKRYGWDFRAALVTLAIMAISFPFIDAPEPASTFMLEYGDQWPAAIYSSIQFIYLGAVMLATGVVCVRNTSKMRRRRYRVGARFLSTACGLGVLLSLCVLVMNSLHLGGQIGAMRAIGGFYDILRVVVVLTMSIGIGLPALLRYFDRRRHAKKLRESAATVKRIWADTVAHDGQTTMPPVQHSSNNSVAALSSLIHRMIVEIHDWSLLHSPERLGEEGWAALDHAEKLCLRE